MSKHQRLWRSAPYLPCSWHQLEPCAQRQRQWRSSAESQKRCEQRRRCGVTSSTAVASSNDLQRKWQGTSRNACRVRGLLHVCAQRLRQWESAMCTVRWAVGEPFQARHARCLLLAVQTASKWAVCVPSVGRVVVCESQIWLDMREPSSQWTLRLKIGRLYVQCWKSLGAWPFLGRTRRAAASRTSREARV